MWMCYSKILPRATGCMTKNQYNNTLTLQIITLVWYEQKFVMQNIS